MKLYLGLLESSLPHETRMFGEVDGKLLDLKLAYAAYLAHAPGNYARAYDLAAFYFPQTIAEFLERGELALKALDEVVSFARKIGIAELRGPAEEKVAYHKGLRPTICSAKIFHRALLSAQRYYSSRREWNWKA